MKDDLRSKFYGHNWQFPGGSESSYMHVVRMIQQDKRLSKKRKQELIDEVSYLVGHILSDVDFIERNYYGRTSIKYLDFDIFDEPPKWIQRMFGKYLVDVYRSSKLESLRTLSNVRKRMYETAKRIFEGEIK